MESEVRKGAYTEDEGEWTLIFLNGAKAYFDSS